MGDFKKCGDLSNEGVGDDFEMGEGCIPFTDYGLTRKDL